MISRLLIALLCCALFLVGCGGDKSGDESTAGSRSGTAGTATSTGDNAAAQVATADEAYLETRKARSEMDSPRDRVAITKKFLDNYLETKNTAGALDAIFYYQGIEMDDAPGAVRYAESIRARLTNPEVALEVDRKLVAFYGESGMAAKMKTLANKLSAAGALDFEDHWNVIEGAVKVKDWAVVRDYCARAGKLANAEAIKAESPNREIPESDLEQAVNDRIGKLMVKDGWARVNQGEVDEALAAFAEANRLVPRYYFDVPEYDLYVYWGNALLKKGDFKTAVDYFADNALILRNEEAMAGLKAAYAGIHGSEDGFDAYADNLHVRIAPTIDDFQLPDYEGAYHRFSDLQADVTLLVLWFPT